MHNPKWDELLGLTYLHYPQNWDEAKEACETLLRTPFLPPHIDKAARINATWYAEPIAMQGNSRFRDPPYLKATEIAAITPPGWSLFNPSIAADPQGNLKMIVRSANYHIEHSGAYNIHDSDGVIRTDNYLCETTWTGEIWLTHVHVLDDTLVARNRVDYLVQGLEDCRLFWNDGWKFSATVRDRHESGVAQMVLCTLDGNTVTDYQVLSDRTQHEKNWMPIDDPFSPMWLYMCYPTMVTWGAGMYHPEGTWNPAPWIARHFRGGTQVIRIDGYFLCLIHESQTFELTPRKVYTHRFVEFDPHFNITRVSHPFTFHGRGIEFAAGLVRQGDDLIISYGINDAKAYLLRMPLQQAMGMLKEARSEDL